jgi:hypothetical protein
MAMTSIRPPKPKPPLEKAIQSQIVSYLKAAGWQVWQTSQGFRPQPGGTRMTKGLPDLYGVHLKYGAMWIEVKRNGKAEVRPEQRAFRDLHECEQADDLMEMKRGTIPRCLIAWNLDYVRDFLKTEGWTTEAGA